EIRLDASRRKIARRPKQRRDRSCALEWKDTWRPWPAALSVHHRRLRFACGRRVHRSGLRGGALAGVNSGHAWYRSSRAPHTKHPVGGLTGRTSFGLLFIDLFFLPENLRGYRFLGFVPCLPHGTSRIFMTKPLT